MIDIRNLYFSYPHQPDSLHNVQFEAKAGECIVLCGQSGAGKSTFFRILNGLIPELYPGSLKGEGSVFTENLFDKEFYQYIKTIGVVFQNPKTQFFTNDVYSELAFPLENYGVERHEIIARVEEVIAEFAIEPLLEQKMANLSGGQQQLVAFASASMLQHNLFLLDEPSSQLDQDTIKLLTKHLKRLKALGMTIIISEHRLYYLTDLVDRYYLMDNGTLVSHYTKEEMQSKTASQLQTLQLRSLETPQFAKKNAAYHSLPTEVATLQLTCQNVQFQYAKNTQTLEIPTLTLTNQQVVGIIGANGAGKSTLSKLLTGLMKPKKGAILLNEKKITPKKLLQESFLVMQNIQLQLFLESVEKELTLNAKNLEQFDLVVEMLQLKNLLKRHPQRLSGGEKQRVAIATALLSGKKIIIFDEPTSGLDLKHMREVSATIKLLQKSAILVIVITHDIEFLNQTCQRILKMQTGTIVEDFLIEND